MTYEEWQQHYWVMMLHQCHLSDLGTYQWQKEQERHPLRLAKKEQHAAAINRPAVGAPLPGAPLPKGELLCDLERLSKKSGEKIIKMTTSKVMMIRFTGWEATLKS